MTEDVRPESPIEDLLARIDSVLQQNRRIEWTHLVLTVILFLLGIACFVVALIMQQFVWSAPSVITTMLLYWPLNQIRDIREKNIALSTVPVLIDRLPKQKAAEEIQKLISRLYGERPHG